MTAGAISASQAERAVTRDAELLDILYEILADDLYEEHGLSRDALEGYLHRHARDPTAAGSVRAFFRQHGLSMRRVDYGLDPRLGVAPGGVLAAPELAHTEAGDLAPTTDLGLSLPRNVRSGVVLRRRSRPSVAWLVAAACASAAIVAFTLLWRG